MARISQWSSRLLVAAAVASAVGCTSPGRFDSRRAGAHVRVLAGNIGSRPSGTDANRRARDYIVEQVRRGGFDVRVQEADGMRPLYGATAHVRNIVATRAGRRPYAIALVTHYDSVPDGPGAADAALGVAVCLEAGRILAARATSNYALALIFTDGEEFGTMGASALLKDPIVGWIRAALNFESIGAGGPALLFETTPGSGTILDSWRRTAWRPAGGAFMEEIYRRLPADTDLTVLKRAGLAGVNFAPAGDSYAYHTPRDSAERLDPFTLTQMGENAIATVEALDGRELSVRDETPTTYFDVARVKAVAYGWRGAVVLFAIAMLVGLVAWIQALAVARRVTGLPRVALTAIWSLVALAASAAAMLGAVWLLRATRESYHPWYAHPRRFYLFEVLTAALVGWSVLRIGRWLPAWLRGSLDPAALWSLIIPCWIAAAIALQLVAPSAAFLAVVPLIAASGAIVVFSVDHAASFVVAIVALLVTGALWLPDALLLLQFTVALLGRLPVVTPLVVYPTLLLVCGLFLVPPLVTLIAPFRSALGWRRGQQAARRRVSAGALLASAVVMACAWCWFAPAYTDERPLQKTIRYVNDVAGGQAFWEVGSNEPGIDVHARAPIAGSWNPTSAPFRYGTPLDLLRWPFAYRARSAVVEPPPLSVKATLDCRAPACTAEIRVVPPSEDLVIVFTLPAGVVPEETNLPGMIENGRYRVIYAAVPATGITWRLRVAGEHRARLAGSQVVAVRSGLPGAAWPALPSWLPAEHVVWRARSYFAIPVTFEAGAPHSEGATIN